jgi:tRNA G10  N-methylase Trm11
MERRAIYSNASNQAELHRDGQQWNFHQSDTNEHLHGLHPYPAKFIPQIARKAIQTWSDVGETVYDPFCGCGTALLEASLLGRPSLGTDNNAVAVLVSRAKTEQYTQSDLRFLQQLASRLPSLFSGMVPAQEFVPAEKRLEYWFSPAVTNRLSGIKKLVQQQAEPVRTLLTAVFSAIVVKVSLQDSDTRYARVSRAVTPAQVDRAFYAKVTEVIDRLPEILEANRAAVEIHQADARTIPFVKDDSISLIVTSPPYLNAYDYHKYHRQRLHWIDGDVAFSRDLEIGKHDEFTKPGATPDQYFSDMNSCFGEWARVLRKRGKCIVVIGDAIVSKKPVSVADTFVDLLSHHKMKLAKHWIRELKSTQRSFNVRNSRITHEHVLMFERR